MVIMKRHWIYILCCSDNSSYTGSPFDLDERLIRHQYKKYDGYTSKRLQVVLVFSEKFSDAKLAVSFEKQIKGWSRKKKEALIARNLDMVHLLSICKNSSHFSNIGVS
jgi:putative endonuclease